MPPSCVRHDASVCVTCLIFVCVTTNVGHHASYVTRRCLDFLEFWCKFVVARTDAARRVSCGAVSCSVLRCIAVSCRLFQCGIAVCCGFWIWPHLYMTCIHICVTWLIRVTCLPCLIDKLHLHVWHASLIYDMTSQMSSWTCLTSLMHTSFIYDIYAHVWRHSFVYVPKTRSYAWRDPLNLFDSQKNWQNPITCVAKCREHSHVTCTNPSAMWCIYIYIPNTFLMYTVPQHIFYFFGATHLG